MSDKDFNKRFSDECDKIINNYKDTDGMYPTLFVSLAHPQTYELETIIMVFADNSTEQMNAQEELYAAGLKVGKEELYTANNELTRIPIMAMFMSEAWARNEIPEPGKRIFDYDDKEEVLIVSGKTVDGRTNFAVFNMNRQKNGNLKPTRRIYVPYKEGSKVVTETKVLDAFWGGVAKSVLEKPKNRKE